MAVTIGELLISFRASTASFAKDLDRASQLSLNTSREIERSFSRIGTVVATELSAAVTAISALVVKSVDMADHFGKLAQSTGQSVEQFSGLAYAAKLSDVSTETLSKSLVILAKNLEKSNQQTLEGKAAHSALATLFRGNIPVFKNTNDAFIQIAAQLDKLPDGFQKTALAAQILGKSGASLIPMFEGLEKTIEEAKKLGIIVSTETAAKATAFEESVKKMQTVVSALGLRLAEQLLPYLQKLADILLETSKNAATSEATIKSLGTAVRYLAAGTVALVGSLVELGGLAAVVAIQFRPFVDFTDTAAKNAGDTKAAVKLMNEQFKGTIETLQALLAPIDGVAKGIDELAKPKKAPKEWFPPPASVKALADAIKSQKDELLKSIATFEQGGAAVKLWELAMLGASDKTLGEVRALQQLNDNVKAGIINSDGSRRAIDQISVASGQLDDSYAKLKIAGIDLFEATRTPLEQYGKAMREVNELFEKGVIDADVLARATTQLADKYNLVSDKLAKIKPISIEIRRSLEEAFAAAIFHAKTFSDAIKDIVVQLGEMLLKMSLTRIFDLLGAQGGILGTLFGGGKASGGPVSGGTPYMVGESGPEMFIPAMSGRIVPNGAIGGGTVINYNIDARGSSITEEQFVRSLQATENRAVQRAVGAGREAQLRT